uniref:Uncharacterized protein n=1 Tax=Anguilla anguilla TaxID=7936 RepID=A0A0E9UCS6_ANGAN
MNGFFFSQTESSWNAHAIFQ